MRCDHIQCPRNKLYKHKVLGSTPTVKKYPKNISAQNSRITFSNFGALQICGIQSTEVSAMAVLAKDFWDLVHISEECKSEDDCEG